MKNLLFSILFISLAINLNAQTNGLNGGTVLFGGNIRITSSNGSVIISPASGLGPNIDLNAIGGGGGSVSIAGTNITITYTNIGTNTFPVINISNPLQIQTLSFASNASPGQVMIIGPNSNAISSSSIPGLTNLPIAPFNLNNFILDANKHIAINTSSLGQDVRNIADYDLKGSVVTNGSIVIMTNNGPMTIQDIRFDAYFNNATNLNQYLYPSPIISIWADGVSNGCQLYSFYACHGQPVVNWHTEVLDWYSAPYSDLISGDRHNMLINCKTNGGVVVTFPSPLTNITVYSDVIYRPGAPTISNSWHMSEVQGIVAPNNILTVAGITNRPGQVESVVQFALSTNGQGYLESKPILNLDNQSFITANGNEDFFGGTGYWGAGSDSYATDLWGNKCQSYLSQTFGWTSANSSYRFFQNAYFTNSFSLTYTNITLTGSFYVSNLFLATYWTTP